MTRIITLTKGLSGVVDEADYERVVAAGRWSAEVRPNGAYAKRARTRLHNFITGWRFVDHINGDGLDNRRANLRPANHATNGRNVGKPSSNTSGFKGVTWDRRARKWRAQIMTDGRNRWLGNFTDPREAARAYDIGAIELHREFARTNFPREAYAA